MLEFDDPVGGLVEVGLDIFFSCEVVPCGSALEDDTEEADCGVDGYGCIGVECIVGLEH